MKHYEIVMLIHPDQNERIQNMIKKYKTLIESTDGKIHRLEELGKKQLAYPIKKLHKAYYILMNIECNVETINKFASLIKFNDSIIRNIIIKKQKAVTSPSAFKNINLKTT